MAVAIVASCVGVSAEAQAQRGGVAVGAEREELVTLERSLAEEHAALSTSDCMTACRALASIRRATERICALDPEERCSAARAKADEATRKVRAACPECAVVASPPPPPAPMDHQMAKGGSADSPAPASAPPSESSRGGCASCTTTPSSPTDLAPAALALTALAFALRRRRTR